MAVKKKRLFELQGCALLLLFDSYTRVEAKGIKYYVLVQYKILISKAFNSSTVVQYLGDSEESRITDIASATLECTVLVQDMRAES